MDIKMETWRNRDMEWRHGHGDMDMETYGDMAHEDIDT
jgi:hypothetical protein